MIGLKRTPGIKIITGIRRSGKSGLIHDFMKYVNLNEENSNIFFIDFLILMI